LDVAKRPQRSRTCSNVGGASVGRVAARCQTRADRSAATRRRDERGLLGAAYVTGTLPPVWAQAGYISRNPDSFAPRGTLRNQLRPPVSAIPR
jgi:hypothetical protein